MDFHSFHCQDLSYKEKHWHESCFLCNKVSWGWYGPLVPLKEMLL